VDGVRRVCRRGGSGSRNVGFEYWFGVGRILFIKKDKLKESIERRRRGSSVWLGMVDYGRLAWKKTLDKCKKDPAKAHSTKSKFCIQWYTGGIFAQWMEDRPHWNLVGPRHNFSG
jgi:hypothetical protein